MPSGVEKLKEYFSQAMSMPGKGGSKICDKARSSITLSLVILVATIAFAVIFSAWGQIPADAASLLDMKFALIYFGVIAFGLYASLYGIDGWLADTLEKKAKMGEEKDWIWSMQMNVYKTIKSSKAILCYFRPFVIPAFLIGLLVYPALCGGLHSPLLNIVQASWITMVYAVFLDKMETMMTDSLKAAKEQWEELYKVRELDKCQSYNCQRRRIGLETDAAREAREQQEKAEAEKNKPPEKPKKTDSAEDDSGMATLAED